MMKNDLNTYKTICRKLLIIGCVTLLSACGGGGGGSAGPSFPSISYSGATGAATIETSNAADFPFAALEGGSGSADNIPLTVDINNQNTDDNLAIQKMELASKTIKNFILENAAKSNLQLVTGASQTVSGTCGGTASYSESSTNSSFNGSITFNNYCEGDVDTYGYEVTLHGQVSYSGTYTGTYPSITLSSLMMTFDYMKMSYTDGVNSGSEEFSGSITMSFDVNGIPTGFEVSANFYYEGQVFKITNLSVDEAAGTISGRLYHPDHGYVDITTTTPFTLVTGGDMDDTNDMFCDGALQITASDGAGGTVTVDFIDYSCTTYDICITKNSTTQCSYGNNWGVLPASWTTI